MFEICGDIYDLFVYVKVSTPELTNIFKLWSFSYENSCILLLFPALMEWMQLLYIMCFFKQFEIT